MVRVESSWRREEKEGKMKEALESEEEQEKEESILQRHQFRFGSRVLLLQMSCIIV